MGGTTEVGCAEVKPKATTGTKECVNECALKLVACGLGA